MSQESKSELVAWSGISPCRSKEFASELEHEFVLIIGSGMFSLDILRKLNICELSSEG